MIDVIDEHRLQQVADRIGTAPGVVGVVLGGSRARGEDDEHSDVDLGLYYRSPLDVPRLRLVADELGRARVGDPAPELTEPGGWGPWVDGGGWLTIDDTPVDWIYRDVDRVARSLQDAQSGRVELGFQVGHPFGVSSFAYAGELALGVIIYDPTGELTRMRQQLSDYPAALRRAVVDALWEADFLLGAATKAARRGDTTFVAGVVFRAVIWCAHAVCAEAGRWVITEKGLVDAAGRLPNAPADFAATAHRLLAGPGRTPEELAQCLGATEGLVRQVRGRLSPDPPIRGVASGTRRVR